MFGGQTCSAVAVDVVAAGRFEYAGVSGEYTVDENFGIFRRIWYGGGNGTDGQVEVAIRVRVRRVQRALPTGTGRWWEGGTFVRRDVTGGEKPRRRDICVWK